MNYIFDRAQEIARHDILCYVNCDIMLTSGLVKSLMQVKAAHARYVVSGRRWDTEITEPWNFAEQQWDERLCTFAHQRGKLQPPLSMDYFVFPRGMYSNIPPLVIGRVYWDWWLIWKARHIGAAVIDATSVVTAVHQNHDYSYHPEGYAGVRNDDESEQNFRLAGGWWHSYMLDEATHKLTASGLTYNWTHWFTPAGRYLWRPVWFFMLNRTRPIRQLLGLRQGMLSNLRK